MNFKNFSASFLWEKYSFSLKINILLQKIIWYIKTYISLSRLHDSVGFVKGFFMRRIFKIVFPSL